MKAVETDKSRKVNGPAQRFLIGRWQQNYTDVRLIVVIWTLIGLVTKLEWNNQFSDL